MKNDGKKIAFLNATELHLNYLKERWGIIHFYMVFVPASFGALAYAYVNRGTLGGWVSSIISLLFVGFIIFMIWIERRNNRFIRVTLDKIKDLEGNNLKKEFRVYKNTGAKVDGKASKCFILGCFKGKTGSAIIIMELVLIAVFGFASGAMFFGNNVEKQQVTFSSECIKELNGYTVFYDTRSKTPWWVYEKLTPESLKGNASRKSLSFKEDKFFLPQHRSTLKDYKGSGFDRGHVAAAGNHKNSQSDMVETFFLSNIYPQVGIGFNRGCWKRLEELTREYVKTNKAVHVITGTLFLPEEDSDGIRYVKYQVIGHSDVAVPTHLFKVLIVDKKDGDKETRSYIIPNRKFAKDVELESFRTTIDKVERVSGLCFSGGI